MLRLSLFSQIAAMIVLCYAFSKYAGASLVVSCGALAGLSAVLFLYHVFIYPFYLSPFRHLPEPSGANFPWAHAEVLRKESNGAPFRKWINEISSNGFIRFRVLFNQEKLLITSPEAMKEVLVTKSYEFDKPDQPSFLFRKLLGNGILVAQGDEHRRQRKALMPAFAYRHIKDLYPVFWSKAKQSTDEIAKVANKRSGPSDTDVPAQKAYEWANRVTLDIIGCAAVGYDFNAISNPKSEIISTYQTLFDNEPPHFRWGLLGVTLPLKIFFRLPLPILKTAINASNKVRKLGYDMVARKRAVLEKGSNTDVDILSVAMTSGQFSDDDLVDQLMTFLAAGHETTASALTWAIYILCSRREIQTKLRTEIRENLPSIHDPTSTVDALQIDKLRYLNAVCNEVLRFLPSVPATRRDALVDTTLQGIPIPKGTKIIISPWAMNVNTALWGEDALQFNPDRWLADGQANAGGAKSNFANVTFLHGPRSCIGKDFAKAEFMCLLAAWIGRFEVSWKDGMALSPDFMGWVTVRPKHKLPVVFREVEGW